MPRRPANSVTQDRGTVSTALSRRTAAPGARVTRSRPPPPAPQGDVVKIPGSDEALKRVLRNAGNTVRPARPGEYLHVSDLLHNCMRRRAIAERADIPSASQILTFTDEYTFAQGDAIADVIMRRFARGAPEQLWGKWRCACKTYTIDEPCTLSEVDVSFNCEHCGTPCNTYVEVSMFDDEYMIVGNPDVLLLHPIARAFHVGELKSIAAKQFDELVRPKPEHVLQTVFYWHLMHRKGYRMSDRASIFYTTKGYVFRGDPYVEFSIDPLAELHRLQDFIEDAIAVKNARAGGALPPRTTCATPDAPAAKKCDLCTRCFSGDTSAHQEVSIGAVYASATPARIPKTRVHRIRSRD